MDIFSEIHLNSNDQTLAENSHRYKIMSLMAVAFLVIFPMSSTVLYKVTGSLIALILVSSAVLYFLPLKQKQPTTHDERLLYLSIVAFFLVALLTTGISGYERHGLKMLVKFLYLLMFIPVYFYFKSMRINVAWVWYGLVLGAIASGIGSVLDLYTENYQKGYPGRAHGTTHPIIFGDLALLMGVMSLASVEWFKSQGKRYVLLPLLAAFSGLLASILSQSRGGWVAIPFLLIVLIRYSSIRLTKLKIIVGVTAIIGVFFLAYQIPQTGVEKRTKITINNVQNYFMADDMQTAGATAVTARFEMWQASYSIFLENPILGIGWGHYRENAKILVEKGERNPWIIFRSHPHSQFVTAMVNGGILGIIAIILLFFVPIRIFYKVCNSTTNSENARSMALAGLILMIGFIVFNLSENLLERSRSVSFYIFFLAVFMAGIKEES